jgi:hypothetical protein
METTAHQADVKAAALRLLPGLDPFEEQLAKEPEEVLAGAFPETDPGLRARPIAPGGLDREGERIKFHSPQTPRGSLTDRAAAPPGSGVATHKTYSTSRSYDSSTVQLDVHLSALGRRAVGVCLQDILTCLPTTSSGQLGDLLPDHWGATRRDQMMTTPATDASMLAGEPAS